LEKQGGLDEVLEATKWKFCWFLGNCCVDAETFLISQYLAEVHSVEHIERNRRSLAIREASSLIHHQTISETLTEDKPMNNTSNSTRT
jgi:hypothetical protein